MEEEVPNLWNKLHGPQGSFQGSQAVAGVAGVAVLTSGT